MYFFFLSVHLIIYSPTSFVVGCFVCWLVRWLVRWLFGWFVGWLVGSLARSHTRSVRQLICPLSHVPQSYFFLLFNLLFIPSLTS